MPAGVDIVRSAGDLSIRVVASKIAGRQLGGTINPIASRFDKGSESADVSEHLRQNYKISRMKPPSMPKIDDSAFTN